MHTYTRLHTHTHTHTYTHTQDCNKCAQELDKRLEELGANRIHPLGQADERTGLTEVEPWIKSLIAALSV